MAELKDQIATLRAQGVSAEDAIAAAHLVPDETVDAHLARVAEQAQASAAAVYAASPAGQEEAARALVAETEALSERAHLARVALVSEGEITAAMAEDLTDAQALNAAGWDGAVTEARLAATWSKLSEAERAEGCKALGVSVEAFVNFGGAS